MAFYLSAEFVPPRKDEILIYLFFCFYWTFSLEKMGFMNATLNPTDWDKN